MVEHAICIKCGEEKNFPVDRCGSCRFIPRAVDEKRKSYYLSEYRFSDAEHMQRWLEDLEAIAARLKKSEPFAYDAGELDRMDAVEAAVIAEGKSWRPMFRYFLLPAVLLVVLWGAVLLLKLSK